MKQSDIDRHRQESAAPGEDFLYISGFPVQGKFTDLEQSNPAF